MRLSNKLATSLKNPLGAVMPTVEDVIERNEPINLIFFNEKTKKFETNPEGIGLIKGISKQHPTATIGIASINGEQRTGKSYFLNTLLSLLPQRIMQGEGLKQFEISGKTKSCTQGIWIWGNPIYIEQRNMFLLLLDCEGFGSVDKSEDHDAKIFCLSVLLSSLLIFNSKGTIDERNIDSLGLAATLAHKVV
jgi:hypothetical protein